MKQYLAVFKSTSHSTSKKATFLAGSAKDAMSEMCKKAGVPDTLSLYEYEIMEIVANGYIPAASKIPSGTYINHRAVQDEDEIEEVETESVYIPYTNYMA